MNVSLPISAASLQKVFNVLVEEPRTPRQVAGHQSPGRDPIMDCPGGHSEYLGDMVDRIGGLEWQILNR
jgi:hypothetical protein